MKTFVIAMSSLACVLLMVVPFGLLKPMGSVATFDMQRVKGQFIHQLALHKASAEVVNARNAFFKQKLQEVIEAYARDKKVVILDRGQALASGKDITETIIPRLAIAMRGSS